MPHSTLLWLLLGACLATGLASWLATGAALRLLLRLELYDRPNDRSSHRQPRPRGGGLAVVPLVLLVWAGAALWLGEGSTVLWGALAGAALVAAVSWRDDLRHLPAGLRLLAQALAVLLGLAAFGDPAAIFQDWLPAWLAAALAGLAWLWFVNLFNFMDGIDGITGVESLCLGAGIALVALLLPAPALLIALPALLAAAALGFLPWNWEPSRLFLGDVGSVTLGYLLGWLLLRLAAEGAWAAALILPAYYLADASLTLARRALRGAKVWQAHREHFYQGAVAGGLSHAAVAGAVGLCNLALIALAALSPGHALSALLAAAVLVAAFLAFLARAGRRSGRSPEAGPSGFAGAREAGKESHRDRSSGAHP